MKITSILFSIIGMSTVLGTHGHNNKIIKDTIRFPDSVAFPSKETRFLGGALDTSVPTSFERSVTMDGQDCQNVEWTVDREAMKITFRFESSEGADWVGFGLSEYGSMKGADLAIVRKPSLWSEEFVVEDRVSLDNTPWSQMWPQMDALQNVELLHAEMRNQRIVAVIRRDLNTCDLDDLPIEPNKQYLVCTSGVTNPLIVDAVTILPVETTPSKALVNLMLDEDKLLSQSLRTGFLTIDSWGFKMERTQGKHTIQVMLPGDATREFLPLQGLSISAAVLHMYPMGINARLQLIRDGVHILDVFKTLSYDIDNQVPMYKQWKFLPGDSLLMTCNFQADPYDYVPVDEEEVCGYTLVFFDSEDSSVSTKKIIAPGYPVDQGLVEDPNSARLGPLFLYGDGDDDSATTSFMPDKDREYFEPLENHRFNICDLALRHIGKVPVYSFAEYNITAMVSLIVTFFFCAIVAAKPVWKRINSSNSDERLKRNTIIYLGQFIYGTFALVVSVLAGIELYTAANSLDGVDPSTYALLRGTIVVQTLLYLAELFYRINIRWEVALHHVLVAVAVIFNQLAGSDTFAAEYILELNLMVFLMAVTDHPLNLTLLLKNMGYARTKWWPKLCKASGVLFVLCKVFPFGFAVALMVLNGDDGVSVRIAKHSFSEWIQTEDRISLRDVNIFLPILFTGLLLVQIYIGYVLWALGCRYEKKNNPGTDSGSETGEENEEINSQP